MATARILFCIICAAFAGRSWMPDRSMLRSPLGVQEIAAREVGVRELTNHNDGKRVEEYLHTVGLHRGDPWCAAFISFVFKQAGYSAPLTGWSPDLFPLKRRVKGPKPDDVFGIYFPELKRIAHCGLVVKIHNEHLYSIEGNTNGSNGREGDGVYRRTRHIKSIRYFSNWKIAIK